MRPTSDRAREALFNILTHGDLAAGGIPFEGAVVLDAFAGTGAFGLEALSRGAAAAIFIEQDHEALAALRKNVEALGVGARAQIVSADATRPPRAMTRCAVAFLDPPYWSGLAAPALAALGSSGWFAADAIAVVEVGMREEFAPPVEFVLRGERICGAARLVFLSRESTTGATQ